MDSKVIKVFVAISSLAVAMAVDGTEKPHDNPPEGFKVSQWQEGRMPPPLKVRRQQVDAVKAGKLRLVPTFVNCSVVWGSAKPVEGIAVEYREVGGEWKPAEKFIYFAEVANYRGSILGLKENTDYEVQVVEKVGGGGESRGKVFAQGKFRTWASEVPIAKTIVIDPKTAKYPIEVRDQGTPEGWIRYAAAPGAVLGGKELMTSIFEVRDAKYVLLDNMTLFGGGCRTNAPVWINHTQGIRIRNCEFYGWGRAGEMVYTAAGRGAPCDGVAKDPVIHNYDGAVVISRQVSEAVVERCYMHDPRGRSNSWYYSHPKGNNGIVIIRADYGVVLRWNDIVGSDFHRFNDCVESGDNFTAMGSFHRDADIYGNFMIFSNDDTVELDGGMQNVRCFQNRFESSISQVSIQGCCVSPVYVYGNLMAGGGDEFGLANHCIKTATFDPYWYAPYALISGNWQSEASWRPTLGQTSRWDCRKDNVVSADPIPRKWATEWPVRELPFVLDTGFIKGVEVSGQPVTRKFKAISKVAQPYRVCKNFDSDWFDISPMGGVLQSGETEFTVTFRPEKMASRRHWRAAFILRTPEGLSRCVSVYADNIDYRTPERPVPASGKTVYAKKVEPKGGEIAFDVTEEGDYHFFVKAIPQDGNRFPKMLASVDGAEAERSIMWLENTHEVWTMVRPGNFAHTGRPAKLEPFHLKPGRHTLTLKRQSDKVRITGAAISDRCYEFEAH